MPEVQEGKCRAMNYATKLKAADLALRRLRSARETLRLALRDAPDDYVMDIARACDDVARAIHNTEYQRQRTVWQQEQILREQGVMQ